MIANFLRFFIVLIGLLSIGNTLLAQETIVKGKVTDASNGDPIPFANVVLKGTSIGAVTDFDGNFLIKTFNPTDSVIASYVGYNSRSKAVTKGITQTINFQLVEKMMGLQEVIVYAGENPAFDILRQVVKNKNQNDKRKLTAYEYDTYTKIEIDIDNITDKFREKKVVKKITQVLDSVERIAGEDGKPILPILITESISKVYYRDNPSLKKELILKTKLTGVGVEDGTTVTQLVGSSFQEYNFYQNWLSILYKEFVSPIADGWRAYYEYDLIDSVYIGNDFCYRLDFYPKSAQDLAFTGTMWITKNEYALRQIDATVTGDVNLNFIEKIRLQQELLKTDLGPWLPIKNRVLINVGDLGKNNAGMLAKFYTSNKNFVTNQPKELKFYEQPIATAEDARMFENEQYWDTLRHEPLSETEKSVYKMIDTLRSIPVVKTYTDIIKVLVDGYYTVGKIDVGPYLSTIAWNNIEGWRFQAGFKTNYQFSKRWVFHAQGAYGFNDEKFKYMANVQRILSRQHWTTLSFRVRSDLGRIGIDDETLADNPLFIAATRWGYFRRGYYSNEYRVSLQRELFKGFSQRIAFRNWDFDPTFNFGYINPENPSEILNTFETSELILEARYARDEVFLQDDNERISLGTTRWPIMSLKYTRGFSGVFGSDFNYDKLRFNLTKRMRTGPLGVAHVTIAAEYVFNTLPYPLLSLHLGNESMLYTALTYNLMNYGEFISDHFASIQYRQYFEGLLLNRVPLLNRLKWRLLATGNVIAGGLRESNRQLISSETPDGEPALVSGYFTNGKPYVELGYGIENIFKFLRVDFVHRISYLDNPDVRKFGVLFTAQFQF